MIDQDETLFFIHFDSPIRDAENIMKKLIVVFLSLLLPVVSLAQKARPPIADVETLIRNATILTVSHGTLTGSDILIRNGKIVAVGPNLKPSANARVIDATGKFVMPGIIDPHSHGMTRACRGFVLAYRCGAVPESHRVPSYSLIMLRGPARTTVYCGIRYLSTAIVWVTAR